MTCMQLCPHTVKSSTASREKITSSVPSGSCTVLHGCNDGVSHSLDASSLQTGLMAGE